MLKIFLKIEQMYNKTQVCLKKFKIKGRYLKIKVCLEKLFGKFKHKCSINSKKSSLFRKNVLKIKHRYNKIQVAQRKLKN